MTGSRSAARHQDAPPRIRTRTPLALGSGAVADIVSFDGLCEPQEHVALVFPLPDAGAVPLVRLHSECLTGDVFGSARCDCGSQLHEAMERIAAQGGALLYLRQEGRGIGLYNKIEAYRLQREQGLDTFAANTHIGFAEDSRSFRVAAEMLQALGMIRIRLLTNNPHKAAELRGCGIAVDQVLPTGCYENPFNRDYLLAKRGKGHTV